MEDELPSPPPRNVDDQSGTLLIIACTFVPLLASWCSALITLKQVVVFHEASTLIAAVLGAVLVFMTYILSEWRTAIRVPWRVAGFSAYSLTIALPTLLATLVVTVPEWLLDVIAFFVVLGLLPVLTVTNTAIFLVTRGDWLAIVAMLALGGLQIHATISVLNNSSYAELYAYSSTFMFVLLSIGLFAFSWIRLKRHAYELWVESWMRFMYRIRATGPGLTAIPKTGPVLVLANHACWWDPLFVAGALPRAITPMMTASFHDIWHLKPFMKHVIKAIRVPEQAMRHETPEILEAIAALKRGECVVIFAEGYLRRKEEMPLRRFGRGVHQILKGAPETPVVAGWIEGAWGSWCSWKDGPPTKNKKFDIRRRIDLSLSEPFTVPAAVLENHLATRMYLMNAVSAARKHLGLEPLPEFKVNLKDETEESAA